MGKWKQKLKFFGGPLDGEFHEIDEGRNIHEVVERVDDNEPQLFTHGEEGIIPSAMVSCVRVVYERCYYHQSYRNGNGRAWPHMLIMGERRQQAEIDMEDALKEVFDMMFGDNSRQML